jgi:hypothetical protein
MPPHHLPLPRPPQHHTPSPRHHQKMRHLAIECQAAYKIYSICRFYFPIDSKWAKLSLEVQFNQDQVSEHESQVGLGKLVFKPRQECSIFSTAAWNLSLHRIQLWSRLNCGRALSGPVQATFEDLSDPAFGWVFGIILDCLVKLMHGNVKDM